MAAKQWTFEFKVSYVPLPREKEAAYREAWRIIWGMIQEANRQVKAEQQSAEQSAEMVAREGKTA